MNQWEISLSRTALKFLHKNHLSEEIITDAVTLAVKKLSGEDINVDLKKLNPPYEGYFRIRMGRMRITCGISFETRSVEVAEVEWHGSAYRL